MSEEQMELDLETEEQEQLQDQDEYEAEAGDDAEEEGYETEQQENEAEEEPEEPRPRRRMPDPEALPALATLGLTDEQINELEDRLQGATTREWIETITAIARQAAMDAARNEVVSRDLHAAQLRKCGVSDEFMDEFEPELRVAMAQLPPELRGTEQGARLSRALAIEARIAAGDDPARVYELAAQASKANRKVRRPEGPPVRRPSAPVATVGRGASTPTGSRSAYEEYLIRTLGFSKEEARRASREVNSR